MKIEELSGGAKQKCILRDLSVIAWWLTMPRFGLFNKIHEKLEEAKISDLNYELGKFAQGSAAYFGSLKADASLLTNKFWKSNSRQTSGLSKSVSLPTGFQRTPENNNLR